MLTRGLFFALRQLVGNIHKKYYYQNKSHRYLSKSDRIPKFHFSSILSSQTVKSKNIIPRIMLAINVRKLKKSLGIVMLVPTKGIANQAADRLMDNPEKALSQARFLFFPIKTMLSSFGKVSLIYE